MKKYVAILLILLVAACTQKSEPLMTSFYFWKTNFSLTPTEETYLKDLNVKKLYIRYFDVALKDSVAIPVAPIVFTHKPTNYEVVPVVYIKNEVFLKKTNTDSLAKNIYNYIQQINKSADVNPSEIQFDCDWSLQSKENYFAFIDHFKKLHENLSATIRLHQVKYPKKTGIPAVSKGVLMYYNMGVISINDGNSIYEGKTAQNYVKALKTYDLPLNIALPIFSWGVHIRNNEVMNVIGGMRLKDFQGKHFKEIKANRYVVTEDFVYKGRYLAKNDEIKLEEPSVNDLKEMMHDIKENSKQKPNEIIFYDLNENNLKAYEKEVFKTLSRW